MEKLALISKQSNRNIELDIVKFYGIILVVLGHIAMIYTPTSLIVPYQSSKLMVLVKNVLYAFHMPLFMFVSGAVFAFQVEVRKKSYNFSQLLKVKAKRLMIPFFVFGFLYVLPTMVFLGFRNPLHYAIDGFILLLDPRHLWFVVTLFFIFLLFYIVKAVFQKLKLPIWGIVVLALFIYVLPISTPYFQINNVKMYFLWFSIGYFLLNNKGGWTVILLLAVIGLGFYYLFSSYISPIIPKISWAIVGITFFYILSLYTTSLVNTKLYNCISRNSFGIYLFHAMIIYWLEFAFQSIAINPILLSLIVFIVSIVLSILFTEGVRKCSLAIIIGEENNKK